MKHTIDLFISGNIWAAKHSDPLIRELFGTDTLPTAYTSGTGIDVVVKAISERNPQCDVRAVG